MLHSTVSYPHFHLPLLTSFFLSTCIAHPSIAIFNKLYSHTMQNDAIYKREGNNRGKEKVTKAPPLQLYRTLKYPSSPCVVILGIIPRLHAASSIAIRGGITPITTHSYTSFSNSRLNSANRDTRPPATMFALQWTGEGSDRTCEWYGWLTD